MSGALLVRHWTPRVHGLFPWIKDITLITKLYYFCHLTRLKIRNLYSINTKFCTSFYRVLLFLHSIDLLQQIWSYVLFTYIPLLQMENWIRVICDTILRRKVSQWFFSLLRKMMKITKPQIWLAADTRNSTVHAKHQSEKRTCACAEVYSSTISDPVSGQLQQN